MAKFCQIFCLAIILAQSIVLSAWSETPITLSKNNYKSLFDYLESAHDYFPNIIKNRKEVEANRRQDDPFPMNMDNAGISIEGVYFSPLDQTEKAARQSISVKQPDYTSVVDFISTLDERYHGKVIACSRGNSYAYRVSDQVTLRLDFDDDILKILDIVPAESANLLLHLLDEDEEEPLSLSLTLLEGGLSDDCNLSTLTESEYISPVILDTLVQTFIAYPYNAEMLKTAFSRFGTLEREDNDCNTTFSVTINPTFIAVATIAKPNCKDKSDTTFSIHYVVPRDDKGRKHFYEVSQDPFMAVKWIRTMEKNLPSKRVDNLYFSLWKKGDIIGIMSDPKPDENLSFAIGIYREEESNFINQMYEAGNLPLAKQWKQLMPNSSQALKDMLHDLP